MGKGDHPNKLIGVALSNAIGLRNRIFERTIAENYVDMSVNEMQAEKLDLIAWISQLQDISLVKKLRAFQAENMEVPETHKREVRKRIKNTDPSEYLSMDDLEKRLRD